MAHIIKLKDALKRKKIKTSPYLTSLLKKFAAIKRNLPEPDNGIHITGLKKLKGLFEAKIAEILIKRDSEPVETNSILRPLLFSQ
jgi:hypothetical protein